jgi:TolB-like protein/Tfp pilus assembly protein PilF
MSVQATPGPTTGADSQGRRLESWKEIAAYLGRDVTTVRRWEKREGLPVRRLHHSRLGSVYAYTTELDAWRNGRAASAATSGAEANQAPPQTVRYVWTIITLAALGLVLVSAWLWHRRSTERARSASSQIRSLAVLPLENLSGDPAQDYLADGMTEALIGRLSGIHDLRVISRTSVMRFKNPQVSAPAIAKTLGVDAIVEGSVTREGNHIRVTAQLIRAATDDHLWSEAYDRQLSDALALESDLAQTIAEKVEVTVSGEEHERLTAAHPIAPEVYENYLQGWHQLDESNDKAGFEKSVTYFQNAVNKDPTFAPAYIGLASAYNYLGSNFVGDPPDPAMQKEMTAAQKALQLDPNLADAHNLLGDVAQRRWQWADAEAEYKRALELSPNNAHAHVGFAWWLLFHGRTDEALARERRALELDRFSVDGTNLGWMLFEARRYDEALRELGGVLAVRPNDPVALWDLGIVFMDKNQPGAAIPVLEKAVSASKASPGIIGSLARAYAQAGRRSDALRLLAELKRRRKAGFVPAGPFVNAYIGLGDKDQAFAWLEQGYKEHSNILRFLKVDPAFDPLRGDPRFADLVRRVGLE